MRLAIFIKNQLTVINMIKIKILIKGRN